MLKVEGIHKSFDGVRALNGVELHVRKGEVHALVGENGAGKTTLGKIIAGVLKPDRGQLHIDGQLASIQNPIDAQRRGIGIIFQELDLFPSLSVAENMVIGNLKAATGAFVDFKQLDRFCRPFLEQVGLSVPSETILEDLPISEMQMVAIARALSMDARLIVMDEATSSLSDDAVDGLFRIIAKLKESGVTILYVSHKMNEILRIADRITVLRDGNYVDTQDATETNAEAIIQMMVGRELGDERETAHIATGDPILSVRNLTTRRLSDVSFELRAGEVLGVAGLVGSGRSGLGAALFGLDRLRSGALELGGRPTNPRSPRAAMRQGIGLLPEDRKLQGLMMQMSVSENASMSVLPRLQRSGFLSKHRETTTAAPVFERTRLRAASTDAAISTLSGGNQQKVLLAKCLMVNPDILFLDEPTRGIDVGAKEDIYGIIADLARSGKGIILVSSELPELLRCCNRIMVLHEGTSMGFVNATSTTQEEIMAMATGHIAAAVGSGVMTDG